MKFHSSTQELSNLWAHRIPTDHNYQNRIGRQGHSTIKQKGSFKILQLREKSQFLDIKKCVFYKLDYEESKLHVYIHTYIGKYSPARRRYTSHPSKIAVNLEKKKAINSSGLHR